MKPKTRSEICHTCGGSTAYKDGKCLECDGKGFILWQKVEPDAPKYEELVEFTRWAQNLWKDGINIMRKHGLKIDNLDDPMQKLAFTFYSDLCEIGSKADHIFEEAYGEKNYKKEG